MKLVNSNRKANLILSIFIFCAMMVFLYSCGNGGSGGDSSETGSVSFGLVLQDQDTVQALNSQAVVQAFQAFNIRAAANSESQFECQTETYEIATIDAQVLDENGDVLAEGGPWDCEDHQGTLSDVKAGDGRIVKVSAKDSDGVTIFAGESEPFAVVAGEVTDVGPITLLRVLPLPPTGVTATAGIGQITLNWLPVADATTYNVYFTTSAGVSKANFEGVFRGVGQTSFIHSNLSGGDSFFYVVTAQNNVGESGESTEVSATGLSLPLPPTGVTATAGIGQITLNWLPVADATTYNVYFTTSAGVSKTNFEGVFRGVGQTSFIHSNLSGGDNFFYVVTAQNNVGESGESTEVSATVPVNTRLIGEFIGTGIGFDNFDFFPWWTGLSDADFDGFGGGNFRDIATSDGIIENGTLTYNLDSDGSLTSTLSNGTVFDGILNPDNNIVAVVDTDFLADDFIEMDVLIKKSTGLTNASLDGEYIGVRISDLQGTALTRTTFAGNSDADGNGTGTFLVLNSEDPARPITYSVDPSDGSVSVSIFFPNSTAALRGIVSGDGNIVSLVDTSGDNDGDEISMSVLIKTDSDLSLSNASLSGDYVAVSFGFGSNGAETARTNVISDGSGNMQFDTFDAGYIVVPNGQFAIYLPNEETLEGIVNGQGDVFTFVNTNPNAQLVGVAIRKTE